MAWLIAGLLGLSAGVLLNHALERRIAWERAGLGLPPTTPVVRRRRRILVPLLLAGLIAGLAWGEVALRCLDTPEVQPLDFGLWWRVGYHSVLAALLLAATVIDFDCYLIPDVVTVPGTLFGVIAAAAIGELQIAHLWVDWEAAIPQLRGPYIPAWYDQHRTWHALSWSLTGLVVGGGLTYAVRLVSSLLLGQQAMGFGDVTLMAMIGSFLGWQAVLLTFLLAPLTGLAMGLVAWLVFNRSYLPYGPYLAAAALAVIFLWRWLWAETRLFFSDLVGVGILVAIAFLALAVLLGGLRLYRSIPTRQRSSN